MKIKRLILLLVSIAGFIFPLTIFASTGTIDSVNYWARLCDNVPSNTDCSSYTKINFRPTTTLASNPVTVTDSSITGLAWSSKIGWINFSPPLAMAADTTHTVGVHNNTSGTLSGYAWGGLASWINFFPTYGGVSINTTTGQFSGYAWISNYGWILFDCSKPDACVSTDWRGTVTLGPPVSSIPSGTYSTTQSVALSSMGSDSIHYTTDGSSPTCVTGIVFSGVIDVVATETINAIACSVTSGSSSVASFVYTIVPDIIVIHHTPPPPPPPPPPTPPTPSPSPSGGGHTIAQPVDLSWMNIFKPHPVVPQKKDEVVLKTTSTVNKPTVQIISTSLEHAIVAVGAVGAIASSIITGLFLSPLSLSDLLLIPIRLWSLLLGAVGLAKRKKPWGTVYDSVTKQPIDPAYVILRNSEGEDVATAITDLDGRYGFVAPKPGIYFIIANKTNYLFPSQKLVGSGHDELYADLYFGEHFSVSNSGEAIIKNIPMDPEHFDWNEFAKKDQHLLRFYSRREKWLLLFSSIFFYVGFLVASFAVLSSETKYNIGIFILYSILFFVRKLTIKDRPLGSITSLSGNPISFAIIRVTQIATGVEVLHRVADMQGRYYCLLPNGAYAIRIDKKMPDGSYKTIVKNLAVRVTKGFLGEKFKVDGTKDASQETPPAPKPVVSTPVPVSVQVPALVVTPPVVTPNPTPIPVVPVTPVAQVIVPPTVTPPVTKTPNVIYTETVEIKLPHHTEKESEDTPLETS